MEATDRKVSCQPMNPYNYTFVGICKEKPQRDPNFKTSKKKILASVLISQASSWAHTGTSETTVPQTLMHAPLSTPMPHSLVPQIHTRATAHPIPYGAGPRGTSQPVHFVGPTS
jgi:hypothetical protein